MSNPLPIVSMILTCVLVAEVSADQSLAVSNNEVNNNVFSVDTNVFLGDEKTPVVQTTTVFDQSRAINQMSESQTLTVFDFDEKLMTVADLARSIQTSISFKHALEFQVAVRKRAETHTGLGAFLANPVFIHEFDAGSSTIRLSSSWFSYEAEVSQAPADFVQRFTAYADWSARLDCMLNPSAPPAQARLELNEALRKQNWRVTHVKKMRGPDTPKLRMREDLVRSKHKYREGHSKSDTDLILEAEKCLQEFKRVSFSAYHRARKTN